jgi:hypothetical protein
MPIKLGGSSSSNSRKPSGPKTPRTRKTMNEILLGNLGPGGGLHGSYSSDVRQYKSWQAEEQVEPVDQVDDENAMDDDLSPGSALDQFVSAQPEFDWSGTHPSMEQESPAPEVEESYAQPWLPDESVEEWLPKTIQSVETWQPDVGFVPTDDDQPSQPEATYTPTAAESSGFSELESAYAATDFVSPKRQAAPWDIVEPSASAAALVPADIFEPSEMEAAYAPTDMVEPSRLDLAHADPDILEPSELELAYALTGASEPKREAPHVQSDDDEFFAGPAADQLPSLPTVPSADKSSVKSEVTSAPSSVGEPAKLGLAPGQSEAVAPPEASYFTASFLEEQDGSEGQSSSKSKREDPASGPASLSIPAPIKAQAGPTSIPAAIKPPAGPTGIPAAIKPPGAPTGIPAAVRPARPTGTPPSVQPPVGPASTPAAMTPAGEPGAGPASFSPPVEPTDQPSISGIAFTPGSPPVDSTSIISIEPTNVAFTIGAPPRPMIMPPASIQSIAPTNVSFAVGEPPVEEAIDFLPGAAVDASISGPGAESEALELADEEIPTFDLGESSENEVVIFEEALHERTEIKDGVEQSTAAPLSDIYRTRRGTIELVIHKDGRMIAPQYNNCGILVGVDLGNGSTLQRPTSGGLWHVLDSQGVEQPSIDIKAVTFDKHGTLWAITVSGERLKVSADGFDAR